MKLLYVPFMLALLYITYPRKKNSSGMSPDRIAFALLSSVALMLAILYIAGLYPAIYQSIHQIISYVIPMNGE